MENHKSFLAGNESYSQEFPDKVGYMTCPPKKHCAIVTCIDARLNPAAHLGFKEGDFHVMRNAGGWAGDCIRDLVVSQQLLGTREIAVFHHTDCGMLTFKNEEFKSQLKEKYPDQAALIDSTNWGAMDDVDQTVRNDVKLLKEHPLLLKEATITGWVYETETGKVRQVV